MNSHILKTTRSQYGSPFDAKNDYVVLNDGRVIGRIFSATAVAARMPVVLDNHCTRASAINSQSWLLRDTRASDGTF